MYKFMGLLEEGHKMKVFIIYFTFLLIVLIGIPLVLNISTGNNIETVQNKISVYNHTDKKIMNMDIEEYIISVVSAEMPADFSLEALKAQAIAARTYAMRKIGDTAQTHYGADICTDFAHCQAYVSKEKMKENWGDKYKEKYNKIKNAVNSTSGEVLCYNNEFAITVFHSCSNGITEKASDVWSGDIPYLKNVKSEGDKDKKDYVTYAEFSFDEFRRKIEEFCNKSFDNIENPIGEIIATSGNNVAKINLFGEEIKGTDIRKIFSLKSSAFELDLMDNKFKFTVYGSGHGVGMSQYGANRMGNEGKTYKEILNHYYPGTEIKLYNSKEK